MIEYIQNIHNLIKQEEKRQINGVELIASENYVSKDVLKAQGSILTNKYAEWYPTKRYYWGCQNVDKIEQITIDLAQKLFKTDYKVNVQPHSWSSANMWVYLSALSQWDTVLWMNLASGWHLTHWSFPSFSGKKYWFYNSISYWIDEKWLIDYKEIEKLAIEHKPKLIIAWASAYSRKIDWNKFRKIADKVGAYLLVDMAHIAWLIAVWEHKSPFWIADFITTTTHKTLRWPRWWMIFSKTEELWKKVNSAIFPWIQWWPLEHIIAAKWVCFAEALTKDYKTYIKQVVKNAKKFEEILWTAVFNINWKDKKIKIVSWWTDNHLLLLDFSELWISWTEVEELLERVWITTNKNTVPWDIKPTNPSGIRIGTPAITSRWLKEWDIAVIANIIINTISIYLLDTNKLEAYIVSNRQMINLLMKDLSIFPIIYT